MARNPVHTGDTAKIEQWFRDNPDREVSTVDLCEIFGLKRWQVNNAITILRKRNVVTAGEKFSIGRAHYTQYRFRRDGEKRNEFKVAEKAVVAKPKPETREAYPVFVEMSPDKASPQLREHLAPIRDRGRIQFLNPTTAIVWNSEAQFQAMRRMALSH